MNRIDRVTAMLIHLQSKKVVKAQDLADRFGVSLRTVYRDLKTLDEAGVPLIGEAGTGYSLMEGYRLPPVMFTQTEATAMLTAEKMVNRFTDQSTQKSYADALYKIKAVLRYEHKDRLEQLQSHIMVLADQYIPEVPGKGIHLQAILESIAQKTVLDIGYTTTGSDQYSNRFVEPVGIYFLNRYWYLIAYCRLRKDYRTFRTDRIGYLNMLEEKFPQQHPSLQSFIERIRDKKELCQVVLLVDKEVMKYFGDQKYYNGFISEREIGEQVEMTFLAESLNGFAKFFLLFGQHADIIMPDALKDLVQQNMNEIKRRMK